MEKNKGRNFFGSDFVGYDDIRLLQIMPLPENMTVMVVDTDDDDNVVMRDCAETSNCYCLALAKDEGLTLVYPYELTDRNGFDIRASVIPIRYCHKCGRRLRPHMEEGEEATLYYTCDCGHTEPGWLDLKTVNEEKPQCLSQSDRNSDVEPMEGVNQVLRAVRDTQYEIEVLVKRTKRGFDVTAELEKAYAELDRESKKIADYAYRLCHTQEEIVIIDRYIWLWPWEKIAGRLRVDVQEVYKLHEDALVKIQKMIENEEDKTHE